MHWFFRVGEQDYGPVELGQLQQMAAAGQLPPDTLIRYGDQHWIQAFTLPQLAVIYQQVAANMAAAAAPVVAPTPAGTPAPKAAGRPAAGVAQKTSPPVPGQKQTVTAAAVPTVRVKAAPVAVAAAPPQGVPAGVPVGQPMPPPPPMRGTPVGQPVAPVGVPVGMPVGGLQPPVIAANASPAKPPPAPPAGNVPAKKMDSGKLILIGLVGCVGLCLVAGVLVIFNSGNKPKDVAVKPTNAADETGAELTSPPEETPSTSPNVQPTAAKATTKTPVAPPVVETAEQKLLKSINRWNDAATARMVLIRSHIRIELVSAWLATDATGTRVKKGTSAPAKASTNEGDATQEAPVEPTSPKYVFVEVQITNDAPEARKYRSWNGVAPETKAILGVNNSELAAIPVTETKSAKRLSSGVDLEPKQSIRDVLVFAAPTGSFEKLQLVLPREAYAGIGKGHTAWEIPQDQLYLEPAPSSATASTNPANPAGNTAGIPSSVPGGKERSEFESLLKDINKVNAPDRPGQRVTSKSDMQPGENKPAMKDGEGTPEMKPETKPEEMKPEPSGNAPKTIQDLQKAISETTTEKPKEASGK